MKLLIAEDDSDTRLFLESGLRYAGHAVTATTNGRDALQLAMTEVFEAIVLDRMMPTLDGLSIVKALRAASVATPILMLTALARVEDRVDGLESGADDYLVKPFAMTELTARLNAIVRRSGTQGPETTLRFGMIEMNLLRREVRRNGVPVELQPREFSLLEELIRGEGRLVTRTMLLERVWNFHFDPNTNIVETHISRLRGKLNAGFDRDAIRTLRGAGYMMLADE